MEKIDNIVQETIIIHTLRNPNPRTGKPDCHLTKHYKQVMRAKMKQELQAIVDRYAAKNKEA